MNEVRNIIVGFDFGEKVSQICYFDRQEGEPVSLPIKVGTGQYTFPNCLSKKPGQEEWHFGLEVEYFVSQHGEFYLENLYQLAQTQTQVWVDNQERKVGELLGFFMKQSLRVLGVPDILKSVSSFMITVPGLNKTMVENLRLACDTIGFSKKRYFFQSYEESFYYYTMNQRPEICSRSVALFSFKGNQVSFSKLEVNRKTIPAQVQVKKGITALLREEPVPRDFGFYELITKSLGKDVYSSCFIVGEGFDRDWAVKSIPVLCKSHRHVFYGNNLFVRGACYAAKEKVEDRKLKNYLYTGSDLVRTNIGMELMISGAKGYYSLVSAGVNWYEAVGECEILLDGVDHLIFLVSDMEGTKKERCRMDLPNLPKRPPKATRLHVQLEFDHANQCHIHVTDMGLGELHPSSGCVWHEIIKE